MARFSLSPNEISYPPGTLGGQKSPFLSPSLEPLPLGALGGQMGLFMGASLITLTEIILIVLGVSACAASSLMRWLSPKVENVEKMEISSEKKTNNSLLGPGDSKLAWET